MRKAGVNQCEFDVKTPCVGANLTPLFIRVLGVIFAKCDALQQKIRVKIGPMRITENRDNTGSSSLTR